MRCHSRQRRGSRRSAASKTVWLRAHARHCSHDVWGLHVPYHHRTANRTRDVGLDIIRHGNSKFLCCSWLRLDECSSGTRLEKCGRRRIKKSRRYIIKCALAPARPTGRLFPVASPADLSCEPYTIPTRTPADDRVSVSARSSAAPPPATPTQPPPLGVHHVRSLRAREVIASSDRLHAYSHSHTLLQAEQ